MNIYKLLYFNLYKFIKFYFKFKKNRLIFKTLKKPTHKGENKAVYDVREAKSNSYHDTNMKLIKDLKRDA